MKPIATMPTSEAFGNVGGNRIGCPSQLRTEFKALEFRKRLYGEFVKLDKEIVRALPRDKRVMAKIHSEDVTVHNVRQRPTKDNVSIRATFSSTMPRAAALSFPGAKSLPVLPVLPVLPLPPLLPFPPQ